MRKFFFLLFFLVVTGCLGSKKVFWCGDHACVNNKEKDAYFKKTMTVEVREVTKKNIKNKSEIEKILKQAGFEEKKRIKDEKELAKQVRLEEKIRIKKEKELAKLSRLEEKKRIKKEKELVKAARLDEKKKIKKNKKLAKQEKSQKKIKKKKSKKIKTLNKGEKSDEKLNVKISSNDFSEIVEKITKKNIFRPYPDINDIPN